VSVGVSVKNSVVGLGFGVYTRAPSATVRPPRRIVWRCGPSRRASGVCVVHTAMPERWLNDLSLDISRRMLRM